MDHLFFTHVFAQEVRRALNQWLGIIHDAQTRQQFVAKSLNCKCKATQKEVILGTVDAMFYELWQARNRSVFKQQQSDARQLVHGTKESIRRRVLLLARHSEKYRKCIEMVLH